MDVVLVNDRGDIIGREKIQANVRVGKVKHQNGEKFYFSPLMDPKEYICEIYFSHINANDITDNLTIKFVSVNDIETSENVIKTAAGRVNKPSMGAYFVYDRE